LFSGRKLPAAICYRPAFRQVSVAAFSAADPTVVEAAGAAADAQPVVAAGPAVARAAGAAAAALAEVVAAEVAAPAAVAAAAGAAEPAAESDAQSLAAAEAVHRSPDHPARDVPRAAPAARPVPSCLAAL